LVDLHYAELFWEAGLHVVADLDQVGHGKFGVLDYLNKLRMCREVINKLGIDRLLYHLYRPISHHPGLAFIFERLIIGLNYPYTVNNPIMILLGMFKQVGEPAEHPIVKGYLQVVDLDELLPHDGILPLPGDVFQQHVPELYQVDKF